MGPEEEEGLGLPKYTKDDKAQLSAEIAVLEGLFISAGSLLLLLIDLPQQKNYKMSMLTWPCL